MTETMTMINDLAGAGQPFVNPIIQVARRLTTRGDDGGAPVTRNNVGLNRVDYPLVVRLLGQAGGEPTRRQLGFILSLLRKYERQITELGFAMADLDAAVALGADEPPRAPAPAIAPPISAVEAVEAGSPVAQYPAIPPMIDVLGPAGVIAQALPGYESRETQVALAQAIADAIEDDASVLAEAGTGTGKSLAYLIPAIYSGRKTLVSTEGKALQDQIAKKDLPFLQRVLPVPFKFAVLKGMANYLCLANFNEEASNLTRAGDLVGLKAIQTWLETTTAGDLAELPFTLAPETAQAITTTSEECLGRDCAFYAECFVMRARAAAKEADVVVVNHTLLSIDIALRDVTADGIAILPDRDVVIVDEAHALEDVATKAFTVELGVHTVESLMRGTLPSSADIPEDKLDAARLANRSLFNGISAPSPKSSSWLIPPSEAWKERASSVGRALKVCARYVWETIGKPDDNPSALALLERTDMLRSMDRNQRTKWLKLERYYERLKKRADEFSGLFDTDDNHIVYAEITKSRKGLDVVWLKNAPISVADDLSSALWRKWPTIATSATLTTRSNFDYFRSRTGAPREARELSVESPFDYKRNAVLYLPQDGASLDPSKFYEEGNAAYFERLAAEIERLVTASNGRAFVLFTSRRALDLTWEELNDRLPWTILRQGDYPPVEMVRRFREDGHAVLFGLRTFMTGVDVAGEALSLVVLDKIPFGQPDDPIYKARCEKLTRDSGDEWAWFTELAIPSATIIVKQAAGRLIRAKSDRGVIALLDGRLSRKNYGSGIVKSLPPATPTRSLASVRAFFGGVA